MSNLPYSINGIPPCSAGSIFPAGEQVVIQVVNPQNKVVVETVGIFQSSGTTNGGGNGGVSPVAYPVLLEFVATIGGAQNINIGVAFYPDTTSLYINGLKQAQNSYSFATGQLHLPGELQIFPEDLISFQYYPVQ